MTSYVTRLRRALSGLSCLSFSGDAAAEQVQGHLGDKRSHALPVAEELAVYDERSRGVGNGGVHGADRNLLIGGIGTGGAGDGKRVRGVGAPARADPHGFGGFFSEPALLLPRFGAASQELPPHLIFFGGVHAP